MFSIGPVCVCVEGYFLYLRDVSDGLLDVRGQVSCIWGFVVSGKGVCFKDLHSSLYNSVMFREAVHECIHSIAFIIIINPEFFIFFLPEHLTLNTVVSG